MEDGGWGGGVVSWFGRLLKLVQGFRGGVGVGRGNSSSRHVRSIEREMLLLSQLLCNGKPVVVSVAEGR